MALQDPVAVFTANSNLHAQALCHMLNHSGIEAHVIEDLSLVGLWMGGTVPGLHAPKVCVERADADRAAAILVEHEQREKELNAEREPGADVVTAECEECGEQAKFPAAQRGSVQMCPHCQAYMDVEEADPGEDWGEPED